MFVSNKRGKRRLIKMGRLKEVRGRFDNRRMADVGTGRTKKRKQEVCKAEIEKV